MYIDIYVYVYILAKTLFPICTLVLFHNHLRKSWRNDISVERLVIFH